MTIRRYLSPPVLLCLWAGMGGVWVAPSPPLDHSSPTPDLLALTQDFWHWKTQDYPQFATQVGINDNAAGRLDSLNEEHFLQRKAKCEVFLERAEGIDPESLSENDFINLQIFKEEVKTYIDNFEYLKFFAPITFLGGPQLSFKFMVEKQMVLQNYNDYQKLLARYGEFPRQTNEILDLMQKNIDSGLMPSNWSMVGVIEQLEKLGGPVEDSVFYKPFLHAPSSIGDQRTTLREQAQERIQQDLLPSFRKLREFIEEHYLPATRPEVAASSLPGGEDYYLACLKFHTTTQLTPQEIHGLGLSEVKRIEEEVNKTAQEMGLEGQTATEVFQKLKEDPAQRFGSKDELLATYRQKVYRDIYPLMLQLFDSVPDENVTVEGVDNPNAVFAYYTAPSMDGSRPGTFYLNSYIYDKHKKYEVTALTLHETIPGHHFHYAYMRMDPSTPDFRKYIDYTRQGDVPSKFPLHTVFVEGWGLYAELLGEELGLYDDPYQRLGRYSFELLRASRLVVDTGLHALGWSRDRAVNFLLEHTGMSETAIQIEVNRYITWPGQACSYKIGEIKIRELRQKAQNALGDLFRLQDFHKVLLQCTGPLNILEQCVNNYIVRTIPTIDEGEESENGNKEEEGKEEKEDSSSPGVTENGDMGDSTNSENAGASMKFDDYLAVILSVSILRSLYLFR
ncbi:uncharacterized protein LOC122265649 [Penaeus japonicus]|uniref:uncharacterized protein LOC122265649 n=1 Tax=Penaeus japonicus TaxID=27405 RepID=UPI001C7152CA|nr:uncharacterized protein LOC122265649 [Penaeus japonicus]